MYFLRVVKYHPRCYSKAISLNYDSWWKRSSKCSSAPQEKVCKTRGDLYASSQVMHFLLSDMLLVTMAISCKQPCVCVARPILREGSYCYYILIFSYKQAVDKS